MAHTKGPWKVETWDYPYATPPRKELKIVSPERLLATLQCDFTEDNPYTIPRAEAESNAQLFAAAPDLLAACVLAYEAELGNKAVDTAFRAAIAKAKKEE